ncbi:MAG: chorismate synthase [Collinsella sp.]
MSSTFGNVLHLSIFGQSHSPAIGCSLDGIPAGIAVDQEQLQAFLDRRAPGRDETATKRREADAAHIIAGVVDGHTTGAPSPRLSRTPTRAPRISELRRKPVRDMRTSLPRVKYHNMHDVAGGGHFSGRLTAPLCIAGGIALQALEARGIQVMAHVAQIGGISDLPMDDMVYREADRKAILTNDLPCIDAAAAGRMCEEILAARDELDSIGGIVECGIYGLPAGIGDPMFDGIENRIAQIAFGIPAVKGVELGMGFAVAAMRGSENNDPYRVDAETGEIEVESNNAGGILGGISTGAPVMWRMAVKPTPSIGREQQTVDMDAMENAELSVHGRHDPASSPSRPRSRSSRGARHLGRPPRGRRPALTHPTRPHPPSERGPYGPC